MAFKQVFYALREVFPQIDLRILKAVASEYSSDVDAAVEFVLSDVLPAVSEPTEAHYTLQDIDYARNDHTNSWSCGTIHERNISPGYCRPLCTHESEECSRVEDKVVINEMITTPTVDYAQLKASSTSASNTPIIDCEQSVLATFVDHWAIRKGKMTPQAEDVKNQQYFSGNHNLQGLLVSSGTGDMLPLDKQSSSDCAVKCKWKIPLKPPKAESTQYSESQDKFNSENLFSNFCPAKETFHGLDDNYDLQVLFEKELKLSEAQTVCHFAKSKDTYNLENLFVGFCSNEDRETSNRMPDVPAFQTHCESEDTCDMQALFEKGMPLKVSATQRILDSSKLKDSHSSQVFLKNIDNAEKELDMLRTAESTADLHKSENLYRKLCAANSNEHVLRFLMKDENKQSSYKLENQHSLLDLFASSKHVNIASQIFEEKDNSCAFGSEEEPSTHLTNLGTLTSTRSMNDGFNLPELFSSIANVSLSDLDLKCEVRTGAEEETMCSSSVDKQSMVTCIVHEQFPGNDMKMMPGADKYEGFLDTSTQSYQIDGINKLVSDVTNGKEALSYLYDSTTIKTEEVELQEGNSRKAKQDAVKAHQDIVAMVEKFNQIIENAKESNDKQAQTVLEEKSLLAALAQDLQSRLTKLSAEKDEVLTIVEEIKLELDARLATSIEEEAVAREQISHKEKLALSVRKEKEAELGSILEVSRKLQKETEENLLLRGLMSDCGRTIDTLQGEISSIHEKVVALKERIHMSELQSGLFTIGSSAAASPVRNCKIVLPDKDQALKNRNSIDLLEQEKTVGTLAKYDDEFSDKEWEMVETTQAYN